MKITYQFLEKSLGFVAIVIALIFVIGFCAVAFQHPNLWVHPDFFINYQGGLIRRGLDGQLLFWIAEKTDFSFISLIKGYNAVAFILFILLIIYVKIKYKIPSFILFSMSSLLLFSMFLNKGLRKDHIIMILVILQSCFFWKKECLNSLFAKTLFILLGIVGCLIHELFFFVTFFPNLIGFWLNTDGTLKHFLKKTTLIIPTFAVSLALLSIYPGNLLQVEKIINSYPNNLVNLEYLKPLFSKTFYFFDQNYNLKNIVLLILMLAGHFVFMMIAITNQLQSIKRKYFFVILLILQTLVLLFLILIAVDYARMIYLCYATVIFYIFTYELHEKQVIKNFQKIEKLCFSFRYIPLVLFFLLTMPYNYWNGAESIHQYNIIHQLKLFIFSL